MRAKLLAVALSFSVLEALATSALAGANSAGTPGSIDVGGTKRTYVMNVPADLGTAVPLVLSFHGHFSAGEQQAELTQLDALSDKYGFIAVYPDGINGSWNDGRPQDAGARSRRRDLS